MLNAAMAGSSGCQYVCRQWSGGQRATETPYHPPPLMDSRGALSLSDTAALAFAHLIMSRCHVHQAVGLILAERRWGWAGSIEVGHCPGSLL